MSGTGDDLGRRLRGGDLTAAPAVLNLVENRAPGHKAEIAALLQAVSPAALGGEARAHVVGVTGPPGAGKSTLLSELVGRWRAQARSVAVLAVDPSSKRSGGALLGDRARIVVDPPIGTSSSARWLPAGASAASRRRRAPRRMRSRRRSTSS